jgi:acetyl esterase/lipase
LRGSPTQSRLTRKVIAIRPAVIFVALVVSVPICAAGGSPAGVMIPIWPGTAPGSEQWKYSEVQSTVEYPPKSGKTVVLEYRNVVTPALQVFEPTVGKGNGTAVIVCPGGGYEGLEWISEGTLVAQWLAKRGVTAFVLKYRLRHTPEERQAFEKEITERQGKWDAKVASLKGQSRVALFDEFQTQFYGDSVRGPAIADGRQAVRFVRSHAAQWNIRADRIGIMGFSAGAGVTMAVAMEQNPEARANFAVSVYGFIPEKGPPPGHAPPLYIVAAQDDPGVPVEESIDMFSRWRAANIPVEMHIYATGGHGFGFGNPERNLPVDHWLEPFEHWLRSTILKPGKADAVRGT